MKYIAIGLIRIYQWCISPIIGTTCRFYPTCSQYSVQAFQKHGFFKGVIKTMTRIVKCGPWHPGGHDEA